MTALIPNRFLFDFEFPLRHRASFPAFQSRDREGAVLGDWTDAELLPKLGAIDGLRDFADVWACWNETGLAIACRVTGKRKPLRCDPQRFRLGDNLRLCTDMRDTRTIKRASRYCQQFFFMPTGGGPRKNEPVAGTCAFERAREDAPAVPAERIRVATQVHSDGYTLEALIPAECLSGFDPVEHPRIGFYYILEDTELGQQYLTIGDDLLWYVDPSTWSTAILSK